MKIAELKLNDCIDGEGISVSLWTQGCPHRCSGCHNPETWDFEGGYEDETNNLRGEIIKALTANGIKRNFSVLGGEPLCRENVEDVLTIISCVKAALPDTKIYLWTGYTYEELTSNVNFTLQADLLQQCDYLIDGPYLEEFRDITLDMRGSSNQRIFDLKNISLCAVGKVHTQEEYKDYLNL